MQSQKPYLTNNGEIYKHIYSSSIYWWSDLKIDELDDGPSESDPLDFISYHFDAASEDLSYSDMKSSDTAPYKRQLQLPKKVFIDDEDDTPTFYVSEVVLS